MKGAIRWTDRLFVLHSRHIRLFATRDRAWRACPMLFSYGALCPFGWSNWADHEEPMTDYTPHQKKIIGRYYDNRDGIMLARLGEIVSELYLADTERKTERLWKRAETAMKALQVPPSIAEHILKQRQPDVLARNLRDWLQAAGNRPDKGGRR